MFSKRSFRLAHRATEKTATPYSILTSFSGRASGGVFFVDRGVINSALSRGRWVCSLDLGYNAGNSSPVVPQMDSLRPRRPLRPPPNYFARSVQVRLMIATFSLLLVIAAMLEARKPENWRWMWASSQSTAQIDSRLASSAGSDMTMRPRSISIAAVEFATDRHAAVRSAGWVEIIGSLSTQQRSVFARALHAARSGQSLGADGRERWQELLSAIERSWDSYVERARDATETLAAVERDEWLEILAAADGEWRARTLPVLAAPLQEADFDIDRAALDAVEQVFDRLAWEAVEDDTVHRAPEQHAWYRLFKTLQDTSAHDIAAASLGPVSFLQLFRQPDSFRGKIVTIRGRARLGYRVPAPQNDFGIDRYYVLWLKPRGGQLSPYVVYTLELPDGFPELREKSTDRTELDEAVEIDGYFFKRLAYRARDGINTAPLLLAREPRWTRAVGQETDSTDLSLGVALVSVLAVALLAAIFARLAYGSRSLRSLTIDGGDRVAELAGRDLPPATAESLRRLEKEHRAESESDYD